MKPGNQSEEGNNGKGNKSLDSLSTVEHHSADHTHDQKVEMQVGLQTVSECAFDEINKSAANVQEESLCVKPFPDQEESDQTGQEEKAVIENSDWFVIVEIDRCIEKQGYRSQQGNQVPDSDLSILGICVLSSNSVVEYLCNHFASNIL